MSKCTARYSKDIKSYLLYSLNDESTDIFNFPYYYQGYYFLNQIDSSRCYCYNDNYKRIYICSKVNINDETFETSPETSPETSSIYVTYMNMFVLKLTEYNNEIHIAKIQKLLKNNYRDKISELSSSIIEILNNDAQEL